MIEFIRQILSSIYDVEHIIQWGGTLLVCSMVFVETGLFVGFFLPGDSLLVTTGVFAAAGHLNLTTLLIAVTLCAVTGDQVGYWIGRVHWGRGYATSALRLLIELAQRRGIPRLDAYVYPDNAASVRVLEHNGFVRHGEVQRDLPQRGGLRKLLHFQREP